MFDSREANPDDALQLSVLFKTVYIQAYGLEGVSKEFSNFIEKRFHTDQIIADIQAKDCKIIVAVRKNNLIGALQIDHDRMCPLNDQFTSEINKLYILPRFHGKGIAKELLQKGEHYLSEINEKKIWLITWEKNPSAIRFYEKQKYQSIGTAPFYMEENTYTNIVMTKEL